MLCVKRQISMLIFPTLFDIKLKMSKYIYFLTHKHKDEEKYIKKHVTHNSI